MSPEEWYQLEYEASKLDNIQNMANYLHRETGLLMSLCTVWARFIRSEYANKTDK
jgi:hypothetical protein